MPPKSKRQRQLEDSLVKGREEKRKRESREGDSHDAVNLVQDVTDIVELVNMSDDALDTENESVDCSFDLDDSLISDHDHMREEFCDEWVLHLERDDKVSLAMFLCFQLATLGFGETQAAEMAGMMVGRSDKSVREWRTHFLNNNGQIPGNMQGKYQRSGVVWRCEILNRKASKYIRNNSNVKGRPNLTVGTFCEWINNDLLPNETLEPGYPRKVSVETARKWMHELGFEVQ